MNLQEKFDNSVIRRQDRLLAFERAEFLLKQGEYGFLALGGDGGYGIPVNFALVNDIIYIHCAPEGEKIYRVSQDSRASFCIVGHTRPIGEKFTTEYESVLVKGSIHIVSNDDERKNALRAIISKYSPNHIEAGEKAIERSFHRTAILALQIEHISAKSKMVNL